MVNDFRNTHSTRSPKSSSHLSNTPDNTSQEAPPNPFNTTGISPNPTGITSPPPFYTKRPNKISKITRSKFLPKSKQNSNQQIHNDQSKPNTQSSLPPYSSINTNPTDYILNASPNYPLNTSSVTCEMDNPVRVYSKTNYSFPPPSFSSDHSDFCTSSTKLPHQTTLFLSNTQSL